MSRKVVMAAPKSGAAIDFIAYRLIQKYQPEALQEPQEFDVERFFENDLEALTGVRGDYQQLVFPIHGYTDSDQLVSVVALNLVEDPSKRNFLRATTAHETGHAVLHVPEFRRRKQDLRFTHDREVGLRMFREDQVPAYKNPEWQAWRFAKALLMPEKMVRFAVAGRMPIHRIALTFGVSVPFVRSRLRDLRL